MDKTRSHVGTGLWLGGLLAAFTISHMPPSASPAAGWINDKVLHFLGFSILGGLTAYRFARSVGQRRMRAHLACLVFLAVYAVLDEATQPIVGRTCSFYDWLADFCGAGTGIALVGLRRG